MKSSLTQEFEAGRNALLNAATAVDSERLREAELHLRSLRTWCDETIRRLQPMRSDLDQSLEKLLA